MLQRIKGICRKIRKAAQDESGSSMITALIVGFVVMVFCLSLLMVSYTLFAQATRKTSLTQCQMLAQSSVEQIGMELVDTGSELNRYLGRLIKGKFWISKDEADTMESLLPGMVTTVSLVLKDQPGADGLGWFQVFVELDYSLNEADDDGSSGGDEPDDGLDEADPGAGGSGDVGNGSVSIHAVITCRKGDGTGADSMEYTIETEFPAVSFE